MVRRAVFVVPFRFETSMRFLRGALRLPGVKVGLVSSEPLDAFEPDIREGVAGHWRVENALDPSQLAQGVAGVREQLGGADCLVGVLEQLQVPLAQVREALEIPGMGVETAHNFRDKARMKSVLREHGVPCAGHRLAHTRAEAQAFAAELGLPLVVKPPDGAGAQSTYRVNDAAQLAAALDASPPHPQRPVLLEQFLQGKEHSFDSVCIDGRLVWHSISRYAPTPMEVLENPWIQWCVLLPREIDGPEYDDIRAVGERAVSVLGLRTGLSHMEWFRTRDGGVAVSEVGARPPGAQFTTLMSAAHDTDMYTAWSRLVIEGVFDPPVRKYAAGAAYLRSQGKGRVKAVHGLEQAQAEMGELVIDVKLPGRGQAPASSYEGEGFVVVRHPDTEVVSRALQRIVSLVRIETA